MEHNYRIIRDRLDQLTAGVALTNNWSKMLFVIFLSGDEYRIAVIPVIQDSVFSLTHVPKDRLIQGLTLAFNHLNEPRGNYQGFINNFLLNKSINIERYDSNV